MCKAAQVSIYALQDQIGTSQMKLFGLSSTKGDCLGDFLYSKSSYTPTKISSEHSPKLQIRSHSYLRAVSEVSINRSLDSLDPATLLTSPKFRSRNESYMRAMSTISQVSEMEVNGQFESVCESVFSELESQAVEALDLPMPGCFRMRSHSYVRAIEKGCSQDDECLSLRSSSPPRTTTTVRTIQSSTGKLQNKNLDPG
uniref:Disks large-associated protein 1 n=1 Tax=Sphaerodactylus townsendi TaxID=933632 RepID=A0ACB8FDC0_9SAUR